MSLVRSWLVLPPGELVKRTWRHAEDDDVLTYAGSLAFHGVLALFPLLVFLFAVLSFFDLSQLMEPILSLSRQLLPSEGMAQITAVLDDVQRGRKTELLSVGALGAIWAASGGIRSAMSALNHAYDVPKPRTTWKRYLLSLAYTLALALLAIVAASVLLIGDHAASWLSAGLGSDRAVPLAWTVLRLPLAAGLMMVATAVAYSALPNLPGFRWITPGAVLAVALWLALSFAFRLYIENFGRYNVLYGSLGAVIVLLLYLWLSAIALLVGGEVNAVIDLARTRARATDAA